MVRCRKTNFRISVIRLIDRGIGHFSLCAARHWAKRIRLFTAFDRDGGDDRLRLTGYGYSCIGLDARSNEKPYSTMRAAPDGFQRRDGGGCFYEEFIGAKKHLVLGLLSHTGPP